MERSSDLGFLRSTCFSAPLHGVLQTRTMSLEQACAPLVNQLELALGAFIYQHNERARS